MISEAFCAPKQMNWKKSEANDLVIEATIIGGGAIVLTILF